MDEIQAQFTSENKLQKLIVECLNKKMKIIKTNIPIILFSIFPISIIIGSSVLLNNVLIGLCFVFIYFLKVVQDFR